MCALPSWLLIMVPLAFEGLGHGVTQTGRVIRQLGHRGKSELRSTGTILDCLLDGSSLQAGPVTSSIGVRRKISKC